MLATKLLLGQARRQLGESFDMRHFSPRYQPWGQCMCVVPDGDLFNATVVLGYANANANAIGMRQRPLAPGLRHIQRGADRIPRQGDGVPWKL